MYDESVKSMRKRTVWLDRQGDYWTDDEKQQLVDMFNEGDGVTHMALQLQRTKPAIFQMIEKMDLYNRKESPVRRKSTPKVPACLCGNCQLNPEQCPYKGNCTKCAELNVN